MFRKFFAALANLTSAVDALAAAVQQARDNFVANLGLDHVDQPEQLEHEAAPARGRKKTN